MRRKVWSRRGGTTPRGMRLLCGMMLSTLALSSVVASEPTIEVEGNRRVDAKAIRQHFHASPDGPSPAAIDGALKELYATGLFEDVKIARSGPRVIVTVIEAPLIERLRFEGNKQVKEKDLANGRNFEMM
jgi:outer membrane protein insertion porin family